MLETGAVAVTITDPRYPPLLREIFDPPVLLFARGRVELLQSTMFGVVGTRRPTPYGMAAAERLSGDLARAGLTIVSGMARGIDTAAHKAALAAGRRHHRGAGMRRRCRLSRRRTGIWPRRLAAKGLMISEFPMGVDRLSRRTFPFATASSAG